MVNNDIVKVRYVTAGDSQCSCDIMVNNDLRVRYVTRFCEREYILKDYVESTLQIEGVSYTCWCPTFT